MLFRSQKLQYLMFPDGILYDKEKRSYLTSRINSVFASFRLISSTYVIPENEKRDDNTPLSSLVAGIVPMLRDRTYVRQPADMSILIFLRLNFLQKVALVPFLILVLFSLLHVYSQILRYVLISMAGIFLSTLFYLIRYVIVFVLLNQMYIRYRFYRRFLNTMRILYTPEKYFLFK